MDTAILYQEGLREYDFGPGHPFRGDRYEAFPRFLKDNLAANGEYQILKADPATDADLYLICQKDYVDFTKGYYKAANLGLRYPDRFSFFHSADNRPISRPGKLEEAARLIVGQAKMACQLIQAGLPAVPRELSQAGTFKKVVSIGGGLHHAKPGCGEGFCLYNDVAFCALYLMQEYKLERILILDTDAHAGNGTAEYFYADPRVLFIDLHQNPATIYPGTGFANQIGHGKGMGFTINVPLPVNAGYDSYRMAFETIVEPVSREFKPQIIIRNGGSDPHFSDGLTSLGLSVKGFRMLGERVREMAKICDGKVIDLIASGYNETVLPYAWLALIAGLTGSKMKIQEPEPIPAQFRTDHAFAETPQVVAEVKNHLKDYWISLR